LLSNEERSNFEEESYESMVKNEVNSNNTEEEEEEEEVEVSESQNEGEEQEEQEEQEGEEQEEQEGEEIPLDKGHKADFFEISEFFGSKLPFMPMIDHKVFHADLWQDCPREHWFRYGDFI
jgi:hypothetical protein